ncbi:hypothetical protein KC207_03590 [Phycicoccus sp. BSK3Z-2]|uniref:Uncharacterized protein n=1 Tax=Phycicoccus avicenniae TaxID=2828860 RepID=A0A941HXZ2_9MICO|nr:hypothetical protein [Phycicoccus avicenniae]MBR7742373.1 hypothetical protein [Phycicoccus avicenniae]
MKPYSDLPARRTAQVVTDLCVLLWVLAWVWVGTAVHEATLTLAEPGRRLEAAGSGFRGRMTAAGDQVDGLPLLEDRIATPFRSAADAGAGFESAGADLVAAVERFALVLGVVVAATPIVLVVLTWLLLRVRFARRAGAAQRFVDGAPDLDLFALRAMANQPMPRLARISTDPAGAWRRGDPEVVRALAVLELRASGLRPPPVSPE